MNETQQALAKRLRHDFRDPDLFLRALTHPSWMNEHPEADGDYERLEFLGDAVLQLVVTEELFRRHPNQPEGELTRARAALVNEAALARVARELGVPAALRLGRGEETSGGREKDSILSDAFESVLGALFLDAGFDRVSFVLVGVLADALEDGDTGEDYKSRYQTAIQADGRPTPRYRTMEESGPDHAKRFVVALFIAEEEQSRGEGGSKKEASQAAALAALEREGMLE